MHLFESVMSRGSWLFFKELCVVFIASSNSLRYIFMALFIMRPCVLVIQVINFSASSSLFLLDIVHVGPAHEGNTSQDENKPAISIIVESVRLVPIRELSDVLMSELS